MKQSLLTPWHEKSGASWEACLGSKIVSYYGEAPKSNSSQFDRPRLIDLTPLPRIGIKGASHDQWLRQLGYSADQQPNIARVQPDGTLIARLSATELIWLNNPLSPVKPTEILEPSVECFHIPRHDSHAELLLAGENANTVLAKLCAVDMEPSNFANYTVAQTSVARTGAIVIRTDIHNTLGYRLLVDSSGIRNFWHYLLDAVHEFAGRPSGIQDLRTRAHS